MLLNDISDHLPVFVMVQKHNEVKGKKIYRYIREVNGDTISAFMNDLLEQHWEHVCNGYEINSAYDKFIKTFMFLYKNCPVKKICINKNRDRHQWFTNGLRNACHKKNKLYEKKLKKELLNQN